MAKKLENRAAEPTSFVGREFELNRFREIRNSQGPNIVVVYGRRRVGKTTLIQRAIEGERVFFFEGSQWEMPIRELPFCDAIKLLGANKSALEQLDGYLAVGGVPEYLRLLHTESSVYLSLAKHGFTEGGFFVHEAERVFVSSFAERPGYRAILESLAKKASNTKSSILKITGNSSGGGAKNLFEDLELCGFIYPYSPFGFGESTRECRWMISDSYLQFFFRLIAPKLPSIRRGEFNKKPSNALSHVEYRKWIGLSFERFCLFHHRQIASVLGFSGVEYQVGPFYQRNAPKAGQLDLVFDRKDRVTTVCEIKYQINPPGNEVIRPFETAIQLLPPNKQRSMQKVLISPNGASPSLVKSGYFDQVIDWLSLGA